MCKILQKKHNILNVNDNSFELRFLFQSEIFISLHRYNAQKHRCTINKALLALLKNKMAE